MKASIILVWMAFAINAINHIPAFPAPPGTKETGPNQFLDKQLITYTDYYEFLFYIKEQDLDLYRQMIPADTLAMYKGHQLWNNESFRDYPVLGLQEQQRMKYCAWRSEAVNFMLCNPDRRCSNFAYWKKFDDLDPDKKYKVVYTLPTKADLLGARSKRGKIPVGEYTSDGYIPGKKWAN